MSFNEPTTFDMLAAEHVRSHRHHVEKVKSGGESIGLLKVAAMYGANASGKSNFVRALSVIPTLLIGQPIAIEPFAFQEKQGKEPATFELELTIEGRGYLYGVGLKPAYLHDGKRNVKVISEYLQEVKNGEGEVVFNRRWDGEKLSLNLHTSLQKDKEIKTRIKVYEEDELGQDTSVLLLSLLNKSRPKEVFQAPFNFLTEKLGLVGTKSTLSALPYILYNNPSLREFLNTLVLSWDTGITKIDFMKTEINQFFGENQKGEVEQIMKNLASEKGLAAIGQRNSDKGDQIFATLGDDGKGIVHELVFHHKGPKGETYPLKYKQESSGTRWLLHLVPVLYDVIHNRSTLVIDEIAHHVHPNLIRELLEKLLKLDLKGQLIFTTHDSHLLDQELLRWDEVWFAEKNSEGATEFKVLSEFKGMRREHKLEKRYLSGRYGGVPHLEKFKQSELQDG